MGDARENATATVLFSDLVGSTELLARLGEVAFDEFRRHHFDTLRAAIGEHAGREIKTTGDGILAVFGSAAEALSCAVRMQQTIDRPASAGRAPVAIRVGLAHGDVCFEDHDVFGIPVVAAARLTAAARGGQILATAVVSAVAGGRATATCADLGAMVLKGLPEPVPVCEVSWQRPTPPVESTPVEGGVQFRVLGPIEVAVDTTTIEIGSAKQRALLAMLVLHPNAVVPADSLIDALWAGDPPPTALPTLRGLVARLRRTLAEAGVSPPEALLRSKGAGYVLETEPGGIDAVRFGALLDQARAALADGQADRAAHDLREALALWRGPAIADLADSEFAQIEARRLDEQRLSTIEELADAELALGHPTQALARLEPLVEANPLRERAWAQLMLARYRLGRQAEALAAYQQLRTILADELGIEPTPGLRELQDRILHQAPELDGPPAIPSHRPAHDHTVRNGAQPDATAADIHMPSRHNLPATLSTFVGRARELAQLDPLMTQTRLVTLTGVGGVGKTRLALRWATSAVPRYPDGVRFVEFASLSDPALVVPTATTAIGFLPSELEKGGQPLLEALCQRLATRRLLLVLDNCEHLVEPISNLAHTLLARCPQLAILATSRETLGIAGEVVCPVAPFAVDNLAPADLRQLTNFDAVQLFCHRASAALPGFAITTANADAVALICQRLDGIALALELAAARIRVLGAHRLAQRLTERLRLLATGPRTTAPRHQTLRAAIDWSYQLLPPAEQTLLAQLSVFPGSFDLDAAEAIAAIGPEPADPGFETLDLLTRLLDKSLIVVSGDDPEDVRYRLLETIREYATEKLHTTETRQATYRRHRDFFLTVAQSYPLDLDWAARIRRAAADRENFRAALTWSLNHGDTDAIVSLAAMLQAYWHSTGGAEGLNWLEHALAAPAPAPSSARVEVRLGLAMALRQRGTDQMSRCFELCEEALAIARKGDEPRAVGYCNVVLWELAIGTGELDRAEQFARETYAVFQACGSSEEQGFAHVVMGLPLMLRGEYTQANEHLEAALKLGPLGDWLLAHTLATQALVSALTGRTASSQRLARDAVRVARRLPTYEASVMALTRAAQAAVLSERTQGARSVLTDLLGVLSALGFQHWVADALELTAIVLSATDPARAAALLGAACTPRELLGESPPTFMSDQLAESRQRTAVALGTQRYTEHEQAGRNKTIHEALAFALDALGPENRPTDAVG